MAKKFKQKSPASGRGTGKDGGVRPVTLTSSQRAAKELDGENIVARRHSDWFDHEIGWRKLMDSLEGGDRYRNAVYGPDRRGMPNRMLFRHKREYPDPQQFPSTYMGFSGLGPGVDPNVMGMGASYGHFPGTIGADQAATAMDDDYELRRSRTPVPEFVADALEIHLAKVYDQEVSREGPDDLLGWWKDVDGCGTTIDDWMRETLAPLLLVLGTIDVCVDHPKLAPGQTVITRADEIAAGLDKVVASYLLPMNVVWWRTDAAGRFLECLVREYTDPADRMDFDDDGNAIDPDGADKASEKWRKEYIHWRLWRPDESILFSYGGEDVIERVPHSYGRVPIVRLIHKKKHRAKMIGKSQYEFVAECQRAYYNIDSELTHSNTVQATPFLSGPEDYCKGDNTLSVGPGYLLPKKKNPENGAYEGFEYVSPPQDPADSLRKNKDDLVAAKDRSACLSKPAGAETPGTVGQSGVSKVIDSSTGHKLLTAIAKSLAKAEAFVAEYALMALRMKPLKPADRESFSIGYPARFDLNDAAALIDGTTKLQLILASVGNAPNTERELIQQTIRQLLLGLDDDEYRELDDEIELLVETKSQLKEQEREMRGAAYSSASDAMAGAGNLDSDDRTGQSGGTSVSGIVPSVV